MQNAFLLHFDVMRTNKHTYNDRSRVSVSHTRVSVSPAGNVLNQGSDAVGIGYNVGEVPDGRGSNLRRTPRPKKTDKVPNID